MILEYEFQYLNCHSCGEKTHCSTCAANIRETLMEADGVQGAEVTIPGYRIRVEYSGSDPDEIEELLEDNAVFV